MKTRAVLLSLALAAPLAATPSAPALAPAPPSSASTDEGGSLEKLLREMRRKRETAEARLAPTVDQLVGSLDAVGMDEPDEADRIQKELIKLGTDAAPLLVKRIDPGANAGGAQKRLATRLTGVLEALPTRAITPKLVEMVRKGSLNGRLNAMTVLAVSPDVRTASEALVDTYRNATGQLRRQAIHAIARLGGPANEAVLVEALGSDDPDVLRAVLVALAEVGTAAGRERVCELAGAPQDGAALCAEILAYFEALHGVGGVNKEDVAALLRLAADDKPKKSDRLALLAAIPAFDPGLDSKLRKLFEPLVALADDDLREAAEICIACLGDRNTRRDLIKRYDDLVARNDSWGGAYQQRAELLLKLDELDGAAKDFRRAIQIYEDQGRTAQLDELYVQLARTYALDGNAKKSHDALSEAKLPRSTLRKLRDDPDFESVLRHSRYGKIFDV